MRREKIPQFKTFFGKANYGNAIASLDGILEYVNDYFAHVHGYEADELIGRHISVLHSKRQMAEVVTIVEEFKHTGTVGPLEVGHVHRDGTEFPMLMLGFIKEDSKGQPVSMVVSAIDVTRKKELEDQLQQAVKMSAVGTLASGIAHDFNNILGAMMGYTQMAMEGISTENQAYQDLEKVLQSGERAADLVRQILLFSRRQKQELVPVQLSFLVKEMGRMLRSSMPAEVEIVLDVDDECPSVTVDPSQIHQVLMNLCNNAKRAMYERSGVIRIGLQQKKLETIQSNGFPSLPAGEYQEITVTDSGVGMDEERLSQLFDPFYTSQTVGEGTGLGLSVAQGIVQNHKGSIFVESSKGKGAMFTVLLPVQQDVKSLKKDATEAGGSGRAGKHIILLVDDEENLLKLIDRMLSGLGYRVSSFTDGKEALSAFSAHPETFDLLLTDISMPGMGGRELADELLEQRPELPIIFCTGAYDVDESENICNGSESILYKPVSKEQLMATVREVLADGSNSGC